MSIHGEPAKARKGTFWWRPYTCDSCGAMSIARTNTFRKADGTEAKYVDSLLTAKEYWPEEITYWYPQKSLGRRFDDVPEHISDAASEAYACYQIRSYRAAILMARSVVEAVAKDKGATDGTLYTKIDKLADDRVISPLTADTAHEIRFMGNDMAHGDFVTPVGEEECDDLLNFMPSLLAEVYQTPAKLSRHREARASRKVRPTAE